MDTVQLLIQAKAAIDTPEKWIKYSRMLNGGHCALGALDWARGELLGSMEDLQPELKFLAAVIPRKMKDDCVKYYTEGIRSYPPEHIFGHSMYIAWYNNCNSTTHKDIMDWFDRAITLATSATMAPALFPVAQMAVAQKEKESELCLQN